jgi:hypothetical protein
MKKALFILPLFVAIATTNVSADIHVRGLIPVLERNNISQQMVIDKCEEKKRSDRQTWFFVSYIDGNNVAKRIRISCSRGDVVDYKIHRISDGAYKNDADYKYTSDGSFGDHYYGHDWSDYAFDPS